MARSYMVAVRTPAAATSAAYAELRTPSTTRARLKAVAFFTSAATASSVGLIRALAVGTASTSVLGQALEPNDQASVVNVDTAWSAAPTVAGTPIYLQRWSLPATSGVGIIYVFPEPVILPVSAGILLWNFGGSTAAALDASFYWEE